MLGIPSYGISTLALHQGTEILHFNRFVLCNCYTHMFMTRYAHMFGPLPTLMLTASTCAQKEAAVALGGKRALTSNPGRRRKVPSLLGLIRPNISRETTPSRPCNGPVPRHQPIPAKVREAARF